MLSIQNIIDVLKNQGANPDLSQINLLEKLGTITNKKRNIFNTKNDNQGLYIWGDVGRGKTLITQSFLYSIEREGIASFHYIDFINFIHNELNKYSGLKNPLKKVSKSINKKNSLIFIDEFQVEDVADAMIIGDLLISLLDSGTKLILTSNVHPDDLYKDGLQRQKFLKSINLLKEKIEIYELDGGIDYRTKNIIDLDKKDSRAMFSEEKIIALIKENFGVDDASNNILSIDNRKFKCKIILNNLLWIELNSFF
jgi:Predicted ATPase